MHAISSYRGNSWTPPARPPQTGPITIGEGEEEGRDRKGRERKGKGERGQKGMGGTGKDMGWDGEGRERRKVRERRIGATALSNFSSWRLHCSGPKSH